MPVYLPPDIGSCSDVFQVEVFNNLRIALYELDIDWWDMGGSLYEDSDYVTTLTYPTVSVPITWSGYSGSGVSGWISQTSTDSTGVTARIKVRVQV